MFLIFFLSLVAFTSASLDLEKFPGALCNRNCSKGGTKVCHFKFILEYFQAMGAACGNCSQGETKDCFNHQCISVDGVERGVMSINRQIPGPSILVCQDDLVVVDVDNHMEGVSTTIHWHGLHMRETPFMDGVPYVTQCPIGFATDFRYSFRATNPGTYFYHAHAGRIKDNGNYGALVVRQKADPQAKLYDYDLPAHTILISDWTHSMAELFEPGLPSRKPGIKPENVLVNGRGQFKGGYATPLEIFKVKEGSKYRFRFIDSSTQSCLTQIQVQGHRLQIIATDSIEVQPEFVDTLVTSSGERYDFVLHADQPKATYCIKVSLIGKCSNQGIDQYAVLSYSKNHEVSLSEYHKLKKHFSTCKDVQFETKRSLNLPNTTCDSTEPSQSICVSDLKSSAAPSPILEAKPDETHVIEFDNYRVDATEVFKPGQYEHFMNPFGKFLVVAALNNISMTLQPYDLMYEDEKWDEGVFCNATWKPPRCNGKRFCHCTHRIKVKLNSIVELRVIDATQTLGVINHPFHIHGYSVYVTKMGQFTDEKTQNLDESPARKDAPQKDNILIPSKGFVTLRFKADNPGLWLLHCHYVQHLGVGMGLVFQVGEREDFVRPPKNFPKCGSFKPDIPLSSLKKVPN